jgi:hypothetical protein
MSAVWRVPRARRKALGARVFALLSVNPFMEQVIPLLQQRGVARADYSRTMLRDHLQEF